MPAPATFTVERDGSTVTLDPDLVTVPRPVLDDAGKQIGTEQRPFLGDRRRRAERQAQPLSAVREHDLEHHRQAVGTHPPAAGAGLDLVRVVASDQPRDPEGIIGVVGVGRLAGEVIAMPDAPALDKAATVVGMLGGLNLLLFLFNLMPLLPLDGGHVAGALWEAAQARFARLRGRPDPGPVDVAKAPACRVRRGRGLRRRVSCSSCTPTSSTRSCCS